MRSPTSMTSVGRSIKQDTRPHERRNTYSSPARSSSEHSSIPFVLGRHSEGAPEVVRRAIAGPLSGRLAKLEITWKENTPKRRDSANTASPMDLNKSLPDLPAPEDEEKESEDASWI